LNNEFNFNQRCHIYLNIQFFKVCDITLTRNDIILECVKNQKIVTQTNMYTLISYHMHVVINKLREEEKETHNLC